MYSDPSRTVDVRVRDLISRMTLEEKVGQLNQMPAIEADFDKLAELAAGGKIGSLVLAWTPWAGAGGERQNLNVAENNRIQRAAVERSRLGIPLILGRDVVHGFRTIFPIPLGQAASWDPQLVEEASTIAAREAASAGVHWTFAPMVDIARDPRWGRVAEGFGEDPCLCGVLAAASVRGFQGDDLSRPDRIGACLKHMIGYGAVEGGRDYNVAEISQQTLRNVYAAPFRKGIDVGAVSVMAAFNEIDGEPCSGSRAILTDFLRGELGFSGFVVSDWASVDELRQHGVADDRRAAARIAFDAGLDMEMSSGCHAEHLEALVESGQISIEQIDQSVANILRVKFRLGLFERPYADPELSSRVFLQEDHRGCARKLAAKSLVLLKNDNNVLPISSRTKIGITGPLATAQRELMGTWTVDGFGDETVSIVDGFRNAGVNIVHIDDTVDSGDPLWSNVDLIVVALGEDHLRSGENASIAALDLPSGQLDLLEKLAVVGKPVVVVICAGRPLVLTDVIPHADAILYAWHPGIEGGNAIADVLCGAVNPSGKLPVTMPRHVGQIPIHYARKNTGRPDDGGYTDIPATPLFAFGYGLSYTTFVYSDFAVSRPSITALEGIEASALITNTGDVPGDEVVQCYIRDVVSRMTRPVRELAGLERVRLEPGESKRVIFALSASELGYWDRDGKLTVEPGRFGVWIAPDSQFDGREAGGEFEVVA